MTDEELNELGSPPQVRGKPLIQLAENPGAGITPAGAGKTFVCRFCVHRCGDHPRRCGENCPIAQPRYSGRGSPPQVRGKPLLPQNGQGLSRITPAGAGKTAVRQPLEDLMIGSPPQVRGKPRDCPQPCDKTRITPAGAGKTPPTPKPARLRKDHPRRCGENMFVRSRPQGELGSPPQVRGKPVSHEPRYIPKRDHPRRCGENLKLPPDDAAKAGSPPQVRGKLCRLCGAKTVYRITPAGAGKTSRD